MDHLELLKASLSHKNNRQSGSMLETETALETEACFKLKGSRVTMTILELYRYDYQSFNDALTATISNAPDFFQQTPVLLGLEKCPKDCDIDFIELTELCREYGMVPVAIRGASEALTLSANVAGLPTLPPASSANKSHEIGAEPQVTVKEVEVPISANKLIKTPVRSGQQIYAPGGDLIVMAPVSAGAEILADGNIHVYGPLRGRALAGVSGDTNARIFCQSLEAELISIAGNYKVNEDLRGELWKKPIKAHLKDDQLILDPL